VLIREEKLLAENYRQQLITKRKQGHKEGELIVVGSNQNSFMVIVRESNFNPLDFSVILAYKMPNSNQNFRLRRYNGSSHEHTNKLEKDKMSFVFHIHMATERYQLAGWREEAYAQPTTRYADVNGAIDCLFKDCGFILPLSLQQKLPFELEAD